MWEAGGEGESKEEGDPRAEERGSTSARIAERCATAAPDTSFAWNVYQHWRWLIIIPRARMHALSPVRSFVRSFFRKSSLAREKRPGDTWRVVTTIIPNLRGYEGEC